MKQYLLSVYHPEDPQKAPPPEAIEEIRRDVDAINAEMKASDVFVFAGGLYPSSTATVLRLNGTEVLTTDGPFAEGKEHIGGFWVIKTPDLDDALQWGGKAARACQVPIEVRPFQDEAQG